jgi:hypothetical protein
VSPCWVNVYQRRNGEQFSGGACFATREGADRLAVAATYFSRRVFVLRVRLREVDNAAARP